jgi:hypothetical protein
MGGGVADHGAVCLPNCVLAAIQDEARLALRSRAALEDERE